MKIGFTQINLKPSLVSLYACRDRPIPLPLGVICQYIPSIDHFYGCTFYVQNTKIEGWCARIAGLHSTSLWRWWTQVILVSVVLFELALSYATCNKLNSGLFDTCNKWHVFYMIFHRLCMLANDSGTSIVKHRDFGSYQIRGRYNLSLTSCLYLQGKKSSTFSAPSLSLTSYLSF